MKKKRPKSRVRTDRHRKVKEKGTNYNFLVIGYKSKELKKLDDIKCSTLFLDWFVDKLDFRTKFTGPDLSVYNTNITPSVNKHFKLLKRELETMHPNVMVVFNYPSSFNSAKISNSGVMISLTIYIPPQTMSKNILVEFESELLEIAADVNKKITDSFVVN